MSNQFRTLVGMCGIFALVALAIVVVAVMGSRVDVAVVVSLVASIAGLIGTIVGYAYGIEFARS